MYLREYETGAVPVMSDHTIHRCIYSQGRTKCVPLLDKGSELCLQCSSRGTKQGRTLNRVLRGSATTEVISMRGSIAHYMQ